MNWTAATPVDGYFDTLSETFRLQVGPLAPGLHTLEIQAVNSEGQRSASFTTSTFVYDPVDGALNSSLTSGPMAASKNGPLQFNGIATAAYGGTSPNVATVQFSLDGGDWQDAIADDGQFDSPIEGLHITLSDPSDGQHSLRVRAVDSDGQVETNIEERRFQVETTFTFYLPMVQR